MDKSTTQFVWRSCLDMPDFTGSKANDATGECWLCGGDIGTAPWALKKAFTSTFTELPKSKSVGSPYVCCSCVALTKKEAFKMACEKHGHSPYFPVKDDKKPFLANWMNNCHVFSKESWLRPSRHELREIILRTPKPPFVIIATEVGKKHIIFRADINYSKDNFIVQFDESKVVVNRAIFKILLSDFEAAYALGLSKTSMVTGEYNTSQCLKIGIERWRNIEKTMSKYRTQSHDLLRLVSFCAKKD